MFTKVILCFLPMTVAIYHDSELEKNYFNSSSDNISNNYSNDSIIYVSLIDKNDKVIGDDDRNSTLNIATSEASELKDNSTESNPLTMPQKWEVTKSILEFPKIDNSVHFKIMDLPLRNETIPFDFLRDFNRVIMPYDIPHSLIKDVMENRMTPSKLISEYLYIEGGLLALISICLLLACVVPGIECWLACRPIRDDYKPPKYPGFLIFLLSCAIVLLGVGASGLIYCNESISDGVDKISLTFETAMEDLSDYYTDTTIQLRKCLTRSLNVANEAIMVDLDNIDELLGKPIQSDLNRETGLESALSQLLEVADASQEISMNADMLIKNAEEARDLSAELNHEIESIRRDLEGTRKGCISPQDRSLCATINTSGFILNFKITQLSRDERLLRLRSVNRDNLTEAARQARGEYLYIPHHVARYTLDARNQIRRELGESRNRLYSETRNLESSNSQFSKRLKSIERKINKVIPYIFDFDEIRWHVGIGTICGILFIWLLTLIALSLKCQSEKKLRSGLLCGVVVNCLATIMLWMIFITAVVISSHTEVMTCRPLEDPNYKMIEVLLETKAFLGKPLNRPLKDLLEKCRQNETVYLNQPTSKPLELGEMTDYWKWSDLTKAFSSLKVDLRSLKILTPSLEGKLDNVQYASGINLTDYRSKIRGPIVDRDLKALSDQIYNIARQLNDRRTSREFETIGLSMRNLMEDRVKPLMMIQDSLVDQLITLEIQLRPYQRKVNDTISQLKKIQYYIDLQGEIISQLKTKQYVERLNSYLDQWRTHVLTEMTLGVAKCPLWDVMVGFKTLFCYNILGPLDGFWFIIVLCIWVITVSTPIAHVLATSYRDTSGKMMIFTTSRQDSAETVVIDRATWRSPDPPPPPPPPPHDDDW
ncbi:uncharacterized protein prom isoform X2 [Chelonus insularis]|uniref:uncharacterized protein prom isoform X2 n=1 Tax=Chelonus insularis TaxID=460826 RepID=UPI00158CBBAB|nr:uncharacterized protein LOC118073799 isoform X2 [Chelonus insularis]